jgi:hypothetical protein
VDNVNVVNEDNPGQVLRNQVVVVSNVNTMYVENVDVNVVSKKTEPVCAREVKDNVGVLAVLVMHSGNVNKNSERMCAREVTRNVNVNNVVLAVLAMNKNIECMCACEMMSNGNVNNVDEINRCVNYVDGYVNSADVNKEVLGMPAMFDVYLDMNNVNNLEQVLLENMDHMDVSRKDDTDIDIENTPRLRRTPQEKGENEKKVNEVKLDKETGNTLKKEKVMRVTEDACNNDDTKEES